LLKLLVIFFISIQLFAKTFSVASYNVENLFDLEHNKTEYKEFIPNNTNWNEEMLRIKLNNLAQVINDLDADILALQEVESKEALELLLKLTPLYLYYDFIKNPSSAIGVAIISKYKIIESHPISIQSKGKFERPIQKVIIEIEKDKKITLFNNHWRSKRVAESKRIQYALSLQKHLESLSDKEDYILIGDFNSNYDEYLSFKHNKKLNDSYNLTGINHVLNTVTNNDFILKENINTHNKRVHYNLWLELPYHERFSYIFQNAPNTPDNIIVSKALFDHQNISYVNNSFKNFSPKYLLENNKIKRWEIQKSYHQGVGYSDHLPILALFSTKKYEKPKKDIEQLSQVKNMAILYETDVLLKPLLLKEIVVLYKSGNNAVLKEKNGRAIWAYNCAKDLREGLSYDLNIQKIQTHFGLKEITALDVLKKYPTKEKKEEYYLDANSIDLFGLKYQNEIVHNLTGIYKKGHLHFNNSKIKLYSKEKSLLPKSGQNITIMSGHLGFYKSNAQIIIYKKSDLRVN